MDRFDRDIELTRCAPDDLCDHFRTIDMRTVTKDRVVHLNGRLYEAPIDLIGERIEVLHFKDDPESIEVRFKGKSCGYLEPPDHQSGDLFSKPYDHNYDLDDILF